MPPAAGTDDVEAVKACLRLDTGIVAPPREGVVGDADAEVLGHLVAVDRGTDRQADVLHAAVPACARLPP